MTPQQKARAEHIITGLQQRERQLETRLSAWEFEALQLLQELATEPDADTARLDYLETLLHRTEFQNSRRPSVDVHSDMHMSRSGCRLYVRNLFATCVYSAGGETVRACLDAAMKFGRDKP